MFFNYMGLSISLGIFLLLAFGLLQWLHIPAGNLVDWVIGISSFWWLLVIVTVPWNVYFDAQEVIAEAAISKEKKLPIDTGQLDYVRKISYGSILVAIALHLLSALGLYILAATGISAVGYVSSGATLLLTALRPAIRAYQYIATRLSLIRQQIKYPREDVLELRDRFKHLEESAKCIEEKLDINNSNSWVAIQRKESQEMRQELAAIKALCQKSKVKSQKLLIPD